MNADDKNKKTRSAVHSARTMFGTGVPTGVKYLPGYTEIVKSKLETDEIPASPVMWADTLLPYSMQIATNFQHISKDYQAIEVDVVTSRELTAETIKLSEFGLNIVAMANTNINQLGSILQLMPLSGLMDQRSVATLTLMTDKVNIADEAAFVRLLCLHMLKIDPNWHIYNSNCMYDMSINARPVMKSATWEITEAVTSSSDLQIPTSEGTSVIYCRTLDQYVALMTQSADENYCFTETVNNVKVPVAFHDMVFIPVKRAWKGQSWLWPYILSFTTRLWWNHSHLVKCDNDVKNRQVKDNVYTMKFQPKAGTVYVPGEYKYICLVIVDSVPGNEVPYPLDDDFAATFDGNNGFSKRVMERLGRVKGGKNLITAADTLKAWQYMCEISGSANVSRTCLVKAAVLCTSKFMGFSVTPVHDEKEHIHGVTCFDVNHTISIDDSVTPDWDNKYADNWETRARYIADWRVDPLYHLPASRADLGEEKPCLKKYQMGGSEYALSQSNANLRILRTLGVLEKDSDCDALMIQSVQDLGNTIIGYGSLIIGLTSWLLAEVGLTVGERNRIGRKRRSIGTDFFTLINTCTGGFDNSLNGNGRYFDEAEKGQSNEALYNIQVQLQLDPNWIDVWYSLAVPWWYAYAVAHKFGLKTVVKTPSGQYSEDGDMDELYGWVINKTVSHQLDICFLTSSLKYERTVKRGYDKYFTIMTPDAIKVGWYYYALTDEMKRSMRSVFVQSDLTEMTSEGVVCLNTVILPSARFVSTFNHPQAFIDCNNRSDPSRDMYIKLIGDLKWPAANLNWFKQGMLHITPQLLREDLVGSAAARLGHMSDTIVNWISFFRGDQ